MNQSGFVDRATRTLPTAPGRAAPKLGALATLVCGMVCGVDPAVAVLDEAGDVRGFDSRAALRAWYREHTTRSRPGPLARPKHRDLDGARIQLGTANQGSRRHDDARARAVARAAAKRRAKAGAA